MDKLIRYKNLPKNAVVVKRYKNICNCIFDRKLYMKNYLGAAEVLSETYETLRRHGHADDAGKLYRANFERLDRNTDDNILERTHVNCNLEIAAGWSQEPVLDIRILGNTYFQMECTNRACAEFAKAIILDVFVPSEKRAYDNKRTYSKVREYFLENGKNFDDVKEVAMVVRNNVKIGFENKNIKTNIMRSIYNALCEVEVNHFGTKEFLPNLSVELILEAKKMYRKDLVAAAVLRMIIGDINRTKAPAEATRSFENAMRILLVDGFETTPCNDVKNTLRYCGYFMEL